MTDAVIAGLEDLYQLRNPKFHPIQFSNHHFISLTVSVLLFSTMLSTRFSNHSFLCSSNQPLMGDRNVPKPSPIKKNFDYKQPKEMGSMDKLSGTRQFKEQMMADSTEAEIRKSWEPALSQYRIMRKKYLLCP